MWHMHIRIFFGWDCLDFGLIRCTASGRLSRLAIGIQNHRDGTAVASPLPFLSSGCTRNMPNILGALFREVGLQGSPKECFPGLVNFVTAVAYHFCLNLPIASSQPGKHSFGDHCTYCGSACYAKHEPSKGGQTIHAIEGTGYQSVVGVSALLSKSQAKQGIETRKHISLANI